MHLKNLALLKTADAGAKAFTAVRFAPLYDAVTTRVFPGLGSDRMALKLNGKDDRLNAQDFLALARTIGLTAGGVEVAVWQSPISLRASPRVRSHCACPISRTSLKRLKRRKTR